MYPLAHLGISLTATRLLGFAGFRVRNAFRLTKLENVSLLARTWIGKSLDARFLLLGAMLPDLIDKPVGLLIVKPSIAAGHAICHTLLFALALYAVGLLLRGMARKSVLALAIGVTWHLVLDYSWQDPHLLFWPFLGQFERGSSDETLATASQDAVKWFINSPDFIAGEIIGAILLLGTFARLNKPGWRNFIRRGVL